MDSGDGPRRVRKAPESKAGGQAEVDALRERVTGLEGQVAALEAALRMMGWSNRPAQPTLTIKSTPAAETIPAPAVSPTASAAVAGTDTGRPQSSPSSPLAAPYGPPPSRPWDPMGEVPAEPERDFDIVGWLTRLGPPKILALVGGGALLLGMAYFLSLAFSRGWITPEMRVLLGLVIGFGLLPAGALLFDRARPTLGHVVVAVGLGTIDLALFASRLYGLVPAELALLGALIAAIGAGVIAVRWNSQLVAGMGIAAVLASPPIVAAPQNLVTVGFLGAVMVGVAYVSFRRDWEWLPWLSFALTAPQLLVWLRGGGVDPYVVMIVLGAYWALFSVSAVVPVIYGKPRPLPTPVMLLGAVAAFATLAAYAGLADQYLRGAFVGALAAANLVTGMGLARRRGLRDDLTEAALGLAAVLYVVAFALALEGPAVTIAWTVAMVAAAFVWSRFAHEKAGAAALVIGLATVIQLLVVDFNPLRDSSVWLYPYINPEGLALAIFLVGLALAGWLAGRDGRRDAIRQALASAGIATVAITVPLEAFDLEVQFRPPVVVLGWTLLAALALGADRIWNRTWRFDKFPYLLPPTGALIGALAVGYLAVQYGLVDFFVRPPALIGTPFTDEQSLMAFVVVIALWAVAVTRTESSERLVLICGSFLVLAALFRQQLPAEWAVVGWSTLAVATLVGAPLHKPDATIGHVTAALVLGAGAVITLGEIAPLGRLLVSLDVHGVGNGPPNAATIALTGLTVGLIAATWREQRVIGSRWLGVGVLVVVVYGLSVGLIDSFSARVPDSVALEEIAKQGQVALTIMWAAIGLGLLAYGLARDSLAGRGAGLALLGLATVKAFVVDLAALDIAYRVLSLLGVGVLLLASAYAYQRVRARAATEKTSEGPAD